MTDSNFPFNDAEGSAVTISVQDDQYNVSPTVADLDGSVGRVLETATKDAGVTTVDVASILLDGEQYIVSENDGDTVMLFAEGREICLPIECVQILNQQP